MDKIRREQVERAIVAARVGTVYLSDFLGPGINWSLHAPDYVCRLWISPPRPPQAEHIAALTRWRDELVAAETPRKAPDDTAPERLRARREALGWDLAQAAEKAGWHMDDIHALEGVCPVPAGVVCKRCPEARVDYDAALTAEEQRRAQEPAPAPAPEVVDVPQPEPWHARLVRLATEAQAAGKTCAEAEAAFRVADAEREKARLARAAAREVCHVKRRALTEATTARAIVDAQQGGAS